MNYRCKNCTSGLRYRPKGDWRAEPAIASSGTPARCAAGGDDGGNTLRSELTLHDPDNHNRPITRFRTWTKTPETVILEYDCDPYSFFRGLSWKASSTSTGNACAAARSVSE